MAELPTDAKARTKLFDDIIEHLRGTCKSVSDAEQAFDLEGLLESNQEFCLALDSELFCCEQCSWWCEHSEDVGDGICEDCGEEGEG